MQLTPTDQFVPQSHMTATSQYSSAYTPAMAIDGWIQNYVVYASSDGVSFTEVARGTWPTYNTTSTRPGPALRPVTCDWRR
jgi:hypothetical protein